jgi:signal transduction histidine kinase
VGLSLYRIVQEALTNVRRHSTASAASVVLRVETGGARPSAEVEVTDNGRARPGTSGSGLGLLGVRERAAARRGEVEIGPRAIGGYRVRVRLPLATGAAAAKPTPASPAGAAGRPA